MMALSQLTLKSNEYDIDLIISNTRFGIRVESYFYLPDRNIRRIVNRIGNLIHASYEINAEVIENFTKPVIRRPGVSKISKPIISRPKKPSININITSIL